MKTIQTSMISSVLFLFAAHAFAELPVGIDVSADFFGKYVWRGQNLNNKSVFQPEVAVSYDNWTGYIWGNCDLTEANGQEWEFTEWDYTIDYTAPVPGFDTLAVSAGVIYYHLVSIGGDTAEAYAGLAVDMPLSPSVTVYHDIDEANGTYVAAGIEHTVDELFTVAPGTPVGMVIGLSVGWGDSDFNDYYWDGLDSSRLSDLSVLAAFPFNIADWTIAPSVNYVTLLSGTLRQLDTYAQQSDYIFAGLNISRSF